ncbi:MAG: hypothetical protein QE265_04795 [Rhodoferax sp.]|nr:hypothetical protein [Rhodoferax sp.]
MKQNSSQFSNGIEALNIDVHAALQRMNGNRSLLSFSYMEYMKKQADFAVRVRSHIQQRQAREARILVHNISSQSALLGIYKIRHYADLLESVITNSSVHPELAESLIANIESNLLIFSGIVNELVGSVDPRDSGKASAPDTSDLGASLETLLENCDPNALRFFRTYEFHFRNVLSQQFDPVKQCIESFEFEKATSLIGTSSAP